MTLIDFIRPTIPKIIIALIIFLVVTFFLFTTVKVDYAQEAISNVDQNSVRYSKCCMDKNNIPPDCDLYNEITTPQHCEELENSIREASEKEINDNNIKVLTDILKVAMISYILSCLIAFAYNIISNKIKK